jgi:hypothetical protein
VDNSKRVLALLDQKLKQLAQLAESSNSDDQPRDSKIKVTLLAGTGGGTGAGMVLDVANAIKSLAATRNLQVEINGVLICTCLVENNSSQLAAANTYALLTELNHATASGNQTTEQTALTTPFESPNSPFDCVYCIPVRSNAQGKDALDTVVNYLVLESRPGARAAIRACRISQTPLEQSNFGRLRLRKVGYASLADQKWNAIGSLAVALAAEVKQHWLTTDKSADWQKQVRDGQRANSPKAAASKDQVDATPGGEENLKPLALRSRFDEFMSLEFTSEVLRQIQTRLESRDTQGRSLISARETMLIADAARAVIGSLADSGTHDVFAPRFSKSEKLRPMIFEVSRQVLRRAIEQFDAKQPHYFVTDTMLQAECQSVLEATLLNPEASAALTAILDLDNAVSGTLDCATSDLLQCGSDRRVLVLVPESQMQSAAVDKLRSLRPVAAVVASDVKDVLVLTLDSGVSPRSLAIGLERIFPGITDAARRLLTRIDIEWNSLL